MMPRHVLPDARGVDALKPAPPLAGGAGDAVPGLAAGAFLTEHEHA
ncbi:hypothetical protein QYH69_20430 [Paraburkholderia sp. SARCC-3016]|nr:hypothetical protein [Paraburkholderia sp. SARCC-3016]MDQ7979614.1 hypothetical protein [Paraburkholderia sp. SARCC-3016]